MGKLENIQEESAPIEKNFVPSLTAIDLRDEANLEF